MYPLLDVRLEDGAIAGLERRLAEAAGDERKDTGHEVRIAVMQPAPVFHQSVELLARLGDGQAVAANPVAKAARPLAERSPARFRLERRAVRVCQQAGQPRNLCVELGLGHPLVSQPSRKAGVHS